ncbi:glycosyltransferase family 2 protein [Aeromonas hydrophila]|uniref:glycosyltransferase family 2 protein n=1 Tax=Aeromonas hydrophila TaxID=644 RepID=UPI002ED178AA|nr:glycosyltransferase family 2 protein [Aeromonas hydrophila]
MPKLSIVTVNYNDSTGLLKTIKSVRSSKILKVDELELVIVDGASTDDSLSVIRQNIIENDIFVSEPDKGIYDAMNKGIVLSSGDWIYFLNAGDVVEDYDVLSSLLREIDSLAIGDINLLYGSYKSDGVEHKQDSSLGFFVSHMINHQSMIYHRSLFEHGYDIRYRFCADYAHLLSIWPRLKPKALDLCIANFDTAGVSSQASNKARMWQERLQAVWRSELNIFQKIRLSSRGFIAWPYHIIKIKLSKVR